MKRVWALMLMAVLLCLTAGAELLPEELSEGAPVLYGGDGAVLPMHILRSGGVLQCTAEPRQDACWLLMDGEALEPLLSEGVEEVRLTLGDRTVRLRLDAAVLDRLTALTQSLDGLTGLQLCVMPEGTDLLAVSGEYILSDLTLTRLALTEP